MTFKSELVFVRILFPFIVGIYFSYIFLNQAEVWAPLFFPILCFTILWLINLFYLRLKAYNFKVSSGILIFIFWLTFGAAISFLHSTILQPNYFGKQVYTALKGWISNEPLLNNGLLRFEITVSSGYKNDQPQKASGKLLIALKVDQKYPIQLRYGDEIIMQGKYLPVEPPYNPAEFDFKAWLASKNIYHQAFLQQDQLIKLKKNSGNPIIAYAITVRKKQVQIYRDLLVNDEAFAVASTLVLGYRADLDQETLTTYSKTGTIHALSVSGMHVGIIYIFLNWALYFLDRNSLFKVLKLLLICSLIWYYSLLTGFSPSVLRSAVMLTVYILAKAFHKNSNSYNILAFTAFSLLIYSPFFLWDVGFQLSFLAVFGLIYLQPKINNWFYFKNKWVTKLWAIVALSLAAQMATFPLSIYYFHQFPVYFIFSNLFILFPLTAMMYLGIGILLFRLYFLAPIFEWVITFTNIGLKWIADLPYAGISAIWITKWELLILSLFIGLGLIAVIKQHKKQFFVAVLLLLVLKSSITCRNLSQLQQQKIIFFSLRRNYAAAFIEGNAAILVTDVLESDKNYNFYVKPALEQLKVKQIKFISWEKDTIIHAFSKKEQQLIFHNYHILCYDRQFRDQVIMQHPKFDAVWLHQNPKKSIADLRNEILFSTILIDASNKDYLQRKYAEEANKINIKAYTLKKNKAYLIDLIK